MLEAAPILVRWVTEPSGTLSNRDARKDMDPMRTTFDGGGPKDSGAWSGSGCKACRSPVLKACRRIPLRWMPAAAASTMIICNHEQALQTFTRYTADALAKDERAYTAVLHLTIRCPMEEIIMAGNSEIATVAESLK